MGFHTEFFLTNNAFVYWIKQILPRRKTGLILTGKLIVNIDLKLYFLYVPTCVINKQTEEKCPT